jgi:hypothetical protein
MEKGTIVLGTEVVCNISIISEYKPFKYGAYGAHLQRRVRLFRA